MSLASDDEDYCSTCLEGYSEGTHALIWTQLWLWPQIQRLMLERGTVLHNADSNVLIFRIAAMRFVVSCFPCVHAENPKIWTQCSHHFHLACIYEWLNRKQTCPICGLAMSFEEIM